MIEISVQAAKIQKAMHLRMDEIRPVLSEYEQLVEKMEIVEYAISERDKLRKQIKELRRPAGTYNDVKAWLASKDATDSFRPRDLSLEFGKNHAWGGSMTRRLLAEGLVEKWGRGLYRKPPVKTGEAMLRVVTAG